MFGMNASPWVAFAADLGVSLAVGRKFPNKFGGAAGGMAGGALGEFIQGHGWKEIGEGAILGAAGSLGGDGLAKLYRMKVTKGLATNTSNLADATLHKTAREAAGDHALRQFELDAIKAANPVLSRGGDSRTRVGNMPQKKSNAMLPRLPTKLRRKRRLG